MIYKTINRVRLSDLDKFIPMGTTIIRKTAKIETK
jgi:hypothetical protein